MSHNIIIAQSGGPTAVINSSVYGAVKEALNNKYIEHVYAGINGIQGILNENIFDFKYETEENIELLKNTPASILGSCRYHLRDYKEDDEDYIKIFNIFKKYNIKCFIYIGGNDSMDTVKKLSEYGKHINSSVCIMGTPKTIDNDLFGIDHCPGFGSAAKYIATSVMELAQDANVYDNNIITIVEVMGRNAGWLAAASAIARLGNSEAPDLIYLPEVEFSFEKFEKDVRSIYCKKGKVFIVVSEGIKTSDGNYVSNFTDNNNVDSFGHSQLGGVANVLRNFLSTRVEKRIKTIEFGILQRCASHCASQTDINEAVLVGREAVKYALNGKSGYMVSLKRISNNPYKCEIELVDIKKVANYEKKIPLEWINEERNFVTKEYLQYTLPLIQGEFKNCSNNGLPMYSQLNKITIREKV